MADCRITCATRAGGRNEHEHIIEVGGGTWKWPTADVVASIEAKANTFYVIDPKTGKRANVGVVRPHRGAPYLRTYADGVWNDNLLALYECV